IDNNLGGTTGPAGLPNNDYSLIKVRPGRVIFSPQTNTNGVPNNTTGLLNTYRGRTEVLEGYLNIRDSAALGARGVVRNGTVVFPGGTLELEADSIPDSSPAPPAPDGTPHLNTDLVIGTENLQIMGTGAGGN